MYIPIPSLPASPSVELYLKRIGAAPVGLPPAEHLDHLHQRHLLSIPFETLDYASGRPVELQVPLLFEKIVRHRRGGDSFELGMLFGWLLTELGFDVAYRIGTVSPGLTGSIGGKALLLVVTIDGDPLLVDVGCTNGLVTPIVLREGASTVTREGMIRIVATATGELELRQIRTETLLHRVAIDGSPVDIETVAAIRNEVLAGWPTSDLHAAIMTESGFARLSGNVLQLPRQNREPEIRELPESRIAYYLEHLFEIETPDAEWGKLRI